MIFEKFQSLIQIMKETNLDEGTILGLLYPKIKISDSKPEYYFTQISNTFNIKYYNYINNIGFTISLKKMGIIIFQLILVLMIN